ncbi:MAG: substrate-binding domain-containing protein [Anaerolineaceae bacterium]|nr:substrate-binding domain-containing protein [Anaerolineaceae bacterium]
MRKKQIFTITSFMIIFTMLLTGCGLTADPASDSGSTDSELTIAGVVFQDDQFMKSMVQGYVDAGAEYGIKILTANTNNDQAKEAELIQTYIAQGVSGIAIAPLSPDASIANLQEAATQGIQVAVTNINLGNVDFLAGGYTSDDKTNGMLVGVNAAAFIADNITGDVNVARVDFDHQLPDQSKARWSGFYEGLDDAGTTYTEVAAVSANLQDDALAKVSDMLTAHPEINVIWACNDGGTIGAAMAVQQAGLAGKVFVFGYDGGDQQTSMILSDNNILIAVVAQDPYGQGYAAVESLALTLLGKDNPDKGKTTIVPGTYLTSTDPDAVNTWRVANGMEAIVSSAPTAAEVDLTIAGVVFQDDQFMKSMVEGFEAAGEKYGIKILSANTNNDQAKEAELIQTYIAQGVNGIAIAPLSPDASIANLKEASDQGIQVAVTNINLGNVDFLAGGYTSDDATNGKLVGTNAAAFIADNITGDVNVARVDFDHQLPDQSKARWSGFYEGLDDAGTTYTEVAAVSANLQDDALAKVSDMLTAHPEINVIWACNDGGTIGAAMAVQQAGLAGKVFVFGYDGGDQQTSMILSDNNILIAVVAQDPYGQGYAAVESLALTLLGKDNPDKGKTTIVPGTYLTSTDPAGVQAWRTANGLD